MGGLVVVCGLKAEAKIAEGLDVTVIAAGGDRDRINAALTRLRPTALLSFGIAGGLLPELAPGSIRVADAIQAPDGRTLQVDRQWSEALARALDVPSARFAGVNAPLGEADAKAACHRATGAILVDMESHHAADWAGRQGVRFAALRVVTDPAERSLPHAATVGMRADGTVDLPKILRSLARNPAQLPSLIRTGLDARAAFAALLRCRQRLGPGFALVDF